MNGTDQGPRIKTFTDATGFIKDVKYENITLLNVKNGIVISMFYDSDEEQDCSLKIENIRYKDIFGTTYRQAGQFFCQKSSPCRNIIMDNVQIKSSGKNFECRDAHGTTNNVQPNSCLIKN